MTKDELMTEIVDLMKMNEEIDDSKQKIEKRLGELTEQVAQLNGESRKFKWPEGSGSWFQIKKSKLGKWFIIPFEATEPGSWIKKDNNTKSTS